jgi:autotransporter adhesin
MMVYNTTATTGINGLQAGMAVWKNGQWVSVDETPYFHVNSTAVGNSTLANSGATGANSMAAGPNAVASGEAAFAAGYGASAVSNGSVALGAGSVASTGAGVAGYIPPTATTGQRTAIGATTSTLAAVSVGDAANGQFRQITGVAAGTQDSDAVNVSQLKGVQGQVAQIEQSTVKYDTNVDGSVNYNSVKMGGDGSTAPVTVHNVAEGVAGTDAVNVNQLNGASSKLNSRIDNLADQVNANTRMLSGGIAASAAMAVVTPVEPGRYHVSGAVAGYNGQAGIGVNLLKRSDNGQTTLHAGVGWGSGGSKAIVRVGFGFSFD